MLPPFWRGGMVTSIESVSGATPITPGNGRSGIRIPGAKPTLVSPGSNSKILRYGSGNRSARNPNPGTFATQPQSPSSISCSVTARRSPGSAPSTYTGPVSG